MNKTLLISLLTILLSCSSFITVEGAKGQAIDIKKVPTTVKCSNAMMKYIETQSKRKVDTKKIVKSGSTITVDYIMMTDGGGVYDTSIRKIAKACGIYNKDRDYKHGLKFTAGSGEMIKGFDDGVIQMSLYENNTLIVPSYLAYGSGSITFPISYLPKKNNDDKYNVGDYISTMNGDVLIESISNTDFTIQNIHPLAGKDLIFNITIKNIR